GLRQSTEDSTVLVHAGFQFALNTVWEDIEVCLHSYRKKFPMSPIFFTGHSLGAAFATLATARFGGSRVALYTFGSPRGGNREFCQQVRKSADLGVYRFVNNADIMTTVPPGEKAYEHTCGLMKIQSDGTVVPGCETDAKSSDGIAQVLRDAVLVMRDYIEK